MAKKSKAPKPTTETIERHAAERAAWETGIVNFSEHKAPKAPKAAPAGPLNEKTHDSVYSRLSKRQARLFRMLSYCRPHGSATEQAFVAHWIDAISGMQTDAHGNRWIVIGEDAPIVAYSAHTDTVHRQEGYQALAYDPATSIIQLAPDSAASCLGADCTTGVWIMLEMIRKSIPGMYLFFRAEEVGCVGSSNMATHSPEILDGIKAVISLDRYGFDEIITHQCSMRTASDDFAESLGKQLTDAHYPSQYGVYTDSNALTDVVGECTNIAVGYDNQHTNYETQHLAFAEALMLALCQLDHSELIFQRKPGETERRYYGAYGNYQQPIYRKDEDGNYSLFSQEDNYSQEDSERDMMERAIRENPRAIVGLLYEYGLDLADVQEAIYAATGYVKYNAY